MKPVVLLWFRRNLRVDDNPALLAASRDAGVLVPIVVSDSRRWRDTSFGVARTSALRWRFLGEGLAALENALRNRGSDLFRFAGAAEEVIPALVHALAVDAVHTSDEPGTEEAEELTRVRAALAPDSRLAVHECGGLYRRCDLPFEPQALPEVFSRFRRRVEKSASIPPPHDAPSRLPPPPVVVDVPGVHRDHHLPLGSDAPDPRAVLDFRGGEPAGQARLRSYAWEREALSHYRTTRNGLLGADFSSKLSPWLAQGSLSPRRVVAEVRRFEATVVRNDSTYWLVFELLWREFYRWVLRRHGARLFRAGGLSGNAAVPPPDHDVLAAWREGRTGMPFIDANMRELVATGYLSNRGRQNVASFLVYELGQDWRRGAAWFESRLLDYDVASNWGSWAHVAGVGNDPRPDRRFNVLAQARRYDADERYVRYWLPELEALPDGWRHTPFLRPPEELEAIGYPRLADPPTAWGPFYPEPRA